MTIYESLRIIIDGIYSDEILCSLLRVERMVFVEFWLKNVELRIQRRVTNMNTDRDTFPNSTPKQPAEIVDGS